MSTAERLADIPADCICRWTAPSGGPWTLEARSPACPADHDVGSGA